MIKIEGFTKDSTGLICSYFGVISDKDFDTLSFSFIGQIYGCTFHMHGINSKSRNSRLRRGELRDSKSFMASRKGKSCKKKAVSCRRALTYGTSARVSLTFFFFRDFAKPRVSPTSVNYLSGI